MQGSDEQGRLTREGLAAEIARRLGLPVFDVGRVNVRQMRDGSTRVEIRSKLVARRGRPEGQSDTAPSGP